MTDYLFDPDARPDPALVELEQLLGRYRYRHFPSVVPVMRLSQEPATRVATPAARHRWTEIALAFAAGALIVIGIGRVWPAGSDLPPAAVPPTTAPPAIPVTGPPPPAATAPPSGSIQVEHVDCPVCDCEEDPDDPAESGETATVPEERAVPKRRTRRPRRLGGLKDPFRGRASDSAPTPQPPTPPPPATQPGKPRPDSDGFIDPFRRSRPDRPKRRGNAHGDLSDPFR